MKKNYLLIGLICMHVFLVGCGENTVSVNVENNEKLNNATLGKDNLSYIGDNLYYDSATRIVYWWNGYLSSDWGEAPSPYYAPNGLPYRYNPETNTFEEIEK